MAKTTVVRGLRAALDGSMRRRAVGGLKWLCQNPTRIRLTQPFIPVHPGSWFGSASQRFVWGFLDIFFGSDEAYAVPRPIHTRWAASVRQPVGATKSQPACRPRL